MEDVWPASVRLLTLEESSGVHPMDRQFHMTVQKDTILEVSMVNK
jgi:hypothetical protein